MSEEKTSQKKSPTAKIAVLIAEKIVKLGGGVEFSITEENMKGFLIKIVGKYDESHQIDEVKGYSTSECPDKSGNGTVTVEIECEEYTLRGIKTKFDISVDRLKKLLVNK